MGEDGDEILIVFFVFRQTRSEVASEISEAARSMGAKTRTIIFRVLLVEARTSLIVGVTIALGTILGYSAMAGTVGGGGLGDIAIRYGYQQYKTEYLVVCSIVLIAFVQLIQSIGNLMYKKMS
jgi:D-methionine transport system permease protein